MAFQMGRETVGVISVTFHHWLPEGLAQPQPDSNVHICGYHVYRCDKGKGGVTCIYVKDNLASKVITCDIIRSTGIEDA